MIAGTQLNGSIALHIQGAQRVGHTGTARSCLETSNHTWIGGYLFSKGNGTKITQGPGHGQLHNTSPIYDESTRKGIPV